MTNIRKTILQNIPEFIQIINNNKLFWNKLSQYKFIYLNNKIYIYDQNITYYEIIIYKDLFLGWDINEDSLKINKKHPDYFKNNHKKLEDITINDTL